MATLSRDNDGKSPTWRIQFKALDGKRRTIRLGSLDEAQARQFHGRVEQLITAYERAEAPPRTAEHWLRGLPDKAHARLARVGLAEPRVRVVRVTLGAMLEALFKVADVKPSTRTRMGQARSALIRHFGKDRAAATIDEKDAEQWRAWLREQEYATATISRTTMYARQFWRWGIKRGMVESNPFAEIRAGAQTNSARQVFIDRATIARVLAAAPDAEWRLLIALSRFGGLRVPSEALALTWGDVDWELSRITIRSSKTEHHEGKGERMIPLFPELREYLQAVFDEAPDGTVDVIRRYRAGQNLNPHFRRIIRRAGLPAWPRTWHNLRASRQTELAVTFPLATACAWMGNSKLIAAGHYLQITDSDWERALAVPTGPKPVHIPAQQVSASGHMEARNPAPDPGNEAENADMAIPSGQSRT